MAAFIKGKELCKNFFFDVAKPILDTYYPALSYSVGLIGSPFPNIAFCPLSLAPYL